MVELPPLRFVRETSRSDKVSIEALVIDIDEQELEDAEKVKSTLEGIDDVQTEADVDDISVESWHSNDELEVDILEGAAKAE